LQRKQFHMLRSLTILLAFLLIQPICAESWKKTVDSLRNRLNKEESDSGKVSLLLELKDALISSQPEEAYKNAVEARKLAEKIGDTTNIVRSMLGECDYFTRIGEYSSALEISYSALSISHTNIKLLSLCHNRIATIHSVLDNYEEALQHNKMCLKYDVVLNDSNSIAVDIHNIGASFMDLKKYDSSLYYLNIAYRYELQKTGQPDPYCLSNIGFVYAETNKFDSALFYHYMAYKLDSIADADYEMAIDENFLATTYFRMKKFREAKAFAYKSIERSKRIKLYDTPLDNYELLYKIYEKEGNYKKAFEYALLSIQISDTLKLRSKESLIIGLETKYRLKVNENIFKVKEAEMAKQKRLFITLAVVSILFVISLFITLIIIFRRQKVNRALMHELTVANESKERLISIISHDLRGSIGTLKSAAKAISEGMTDLEDTRNLLESFYPVADSTYDLLENLLTWARISKNTLAPFFDVLDIHELVEKSLDHTKHLANSKSIKFINKVESVPIKVDKNMILAVIRNLLSNAIKFSYPGTDVLIESSIRDGQIIVAVEDQGVGISKEGLLKIFDVQNNYHSSGTRGERGSGLGLPLSKIFIQKNGGKIWVESFEGEGSTFYFSLPIEY
jgi:two-component system, sensor histidine kinase and response regulator